MSVSPLLQALRSGTQTAHQQLEDVTLGNKIMDGSLTPAEYHRILAWQRAVHEVLEPSVVGFTLGEYRYRPRFIPNTQDAAVADELPTTVGRVYVLEGASLGGSMIYRKLRTNAKLTQEAPFTFYHHQADWGLRQWRSFVGALNARTFTEEEIHQAVKSAQDTFATFARQWAATAG
ncbi:biliverdin-producing heme oxygenase [Neolewinella sp.]|uniref:biliverdin-producing heme oxygenase n=1 Tax=Neolewinella sp. TaxID=2993543 RepID=UPI003B5248F8